VQVVLKNSSKKSKLFPSNNTKKLKWQATMVGILTLALLILLWRGFWQRKTSINNTEYIPPALVMTGGNSYIRALMRTISASEAQDSNPYTLLYGGEHFWELNRHPDRCITIVSGPHQGECTTAAGRYQLLTSTWQKKVRQYHPKHLKENRISYSFEPELQDRVVYAWLSDRHAWGNDIAALLKQGKLEQVLQLLSGTWTSLGYGIENNSITPILTRIYQKVLAEELAQANSTSTQEKQDIRH
jgi:muramidase (phage lysozyme)